MIIFAVSNTVVPYLLRKTFFLFQIAQRRIHTDERKKREETSFALYKQSG